PAGVGTQYGRAETNRWAPNRVCGAHADRPKDTADTDSVEKPSKRGVPGGRAPRARMDARPPDAVVDTRARIGPASLGWAASESADARTTRAPANRHRSRHGPGDLRRHRP